MSSRQDTFAFACAALLVVVALLFGGGPRGMGDTWVHACAIPCIGLAAWRWRWRDASPWERAFLVFCGCALALIALQLLPLPPAWFAGLPQRAGVQADLALAGVAPAWRPMTLDAWATVRGAMAFTVFAAIWALCTTLDARMQRRLLAIALGVGVALAFFGFAQAAAGTHALRFHAFHHPVGAIGTFANRNHFASLLAMLIPIALAFAAGAQRDGRRPVAIAAFTAAFACWLAAALTYSRTGFALASLTFAAGIAVFWWPRAGAMRRWIAPACVLGLAMLAIGHYAWDGLVQRLDQDPLADGRWQYLRFGVDAMQAYLPWGSGLGSFPWVYAPFEPIAAMGPTFAERAHNEPLQIAIEAGLPGLALLLAFVVLVAVKASRTFLMWQKNPLRENVTQGAIALALSVPILHGWVDYPLRTLAVSVLAGLLLSTRGETRQASLLPGRTGSVV